MPYNNRPPPTKSPAPPRAVRSPQPVFEVEVLPGLEGLARDELVARLGGKVLWESSARADVLRLRYSGDWRALLALRAAVAVYLVGRFPVPRPRALLGVEHFTALVGLIEQVRSLHPPGLFKTFRISAAGEESAVLQRLRTELAARLELIPAPDEADLLLRLRRAADGAEAWEVLVRLSPRPLTARAWRVCSLAGALNAVVAHAMAVFSEPTATDRVLNVACGSGTLLVERLALAPARWALGIDHNAEALACARANTAAAGLAGRVRLVQGDGTRMPLPAACVDMICADLPFGQLVGSHADNTRLYPALLQEATRVAAAGARLVLVTHEVRLIERLLTGLASAWEPVRTERITLPFGTGGLNPRIYVLRRVLDGAP